MGQGTGEIGFAHGGRPGGDQVVPFAHPIAAGQALHQLGIEVPGVLIVEVFQSSLLFEFGVAQAAGKATIVPSEHLPVNQQAQPLVQGQVFALLSSSCSWRARAIPSSFMARKCCRVG